MIRRPPRSPLFPYTPLSRSRLVVVAAPGGERRQLEEGRAGVEEPVDPVADEELAARGVTGPRLGRPTPGDAGAGLPQGPNQARSEEHTSELQSQSNLVCPPL